MTPPCTTKACRDGITNAWLNDFASCPTATCGLQESYQVRPPKCFEFNRRTSTAKLVAPQACAKQVSAKDDGASVIAIGEGAADDADDDIDNGDEGAADANADDGIRADESEVSSRQVDEVADHGRIVAGVPAQGGHEPSGSAAEVHAAAQGRCESFCDGAQWAVKLDWKQKCRSSFKDGKCSACSECTPSKPAPAAITCATWCTKASWAKKVDWKDKCKPSFRGHKCGGCSECAASVPTAPTDKCASWCTKASWAKNVDWKDKCKDSYKSGKCAGCSQCSSVSPPSPSFAPSSRRVCPASPRKRCAAYCSPPHTPRPDGHVSGVGDGRPIKGDIKTCQEACTKQPGCVAFDYGWGQCFLKSSAPSKAKGGSSWRMYWRTDKTTPPAGCKVDAAGGTAPECTRALAGCLEFDVTKLLDGQCSCSMCLPVANCKKQASGASCACDVCSNGYVTDGEGQCSKPSATSLSETSSEHKLGASVAMSKGYHLTTQRNGWQPRRMQSASCKPSHGREKLIVAWDSTEPKGYLAEFEIRSDGSAALISNRAQPTCEEMGDVTAAADCSVIAALCHSRHGRGIEIADRTYPGVVDFQAKSGKYGWGWTNDSPPMPLDRQEELYLVEYTRGTTNRKAPSETVVVNKAVGGAPIGNWAISLDEAKEVYLLDMKVTTGHHEGSLGVGVQRGTWQWRQDLTSGWACGVGHTIGNKLTYNKELGTWARLCWTDNSARNAAEPTGPYAGTYLFGFFFQTLPQSAGTHAVQISAQPSAKYNVDSPGGPHSIISLGKQGWMAVGFGPVPKDDEKPLEQRQLALSIAKLPASSNDCGSNTPYNNYGRVKDDDKCNWKYLTTLPGQSVWNYDGQRGGLGYVNLQTIGDNDDELLVGYATNVKHQDGDHQAPTYRVAKITREGEVKSTKKLEGAGWGEDDVWARLSNGCVAFPSVAIANPGGEYSPSDDGADKMRITLICDDY